MGRVSHAWTNVRGYGLWILFVTGALVAAGVWFSRSELNRIQEAKFKELGAIAQLKVRQVLEWRRELKSDVERSTFSPYFREATARWFENPRDEVSATTFLERLKVETDVDFYSDVLLLGPDCQVEIILQDAASEFPIQSVEACRRAVSAGESVISDIFERAHGASGVDVIAPIRDHHGRVIGALDLRSDAGTYLVPLLSLWPTASQSAEASLVQREGGNALLIGKMRGQRSAAPNSATSNTPVARAARGEVGRIRGADYRGVDVLADLRRVPDSPWIMVTKEDASEILAEGRFRAEVSTVAVGALILLAIASLCFGYKYQQQVSRRAALEVQAARLRLLQLPSDVPIAGLLERALEEASSLTQSRNGFFHTFAPDGQTSDLQVSLPSRTKDVEPHTTNEHGPTFNPSLRERLRSGQALILEGSANPDLSIGGSAREALAPVLREGKTVAVLGVANRRQPYTEDDRAALVQLAELSWDIVARRRTELQQASLEEQVRLTQRMEAIGRLAGGVAHDFNNLLLVIQSCSEFLLEDLPEGDARRGDVEEIRAAGERASALTRQLLAFSRKQMLIPSVLDLNEVVNGMVEMFEHLAGESTIIRLQLSEAPLKVKVDRGQLEQVMTNLVVNARDAMTNGGTITIETRFCTEEIAAIECAEREFSGPCAILVISDTGSGMDDDVKHRIFDPFFSTKVQGKGTGLGLATVYGIVRQSGGLICVDSTKGRGTSFKICLPLTEEVSNVEIAARGTVPRGTEKVLLVEDNLAVREQIQRILARTGYDVTTAASGDEVMRFTRERLGEFSLVVSDVVMPGLGGCELAEQLLAAHPELKVLLMSGYTDQCNVLASGLGPNLHFIGKPFGSDALARKVREMLNNVA